MFSYIIIKKDVYILENKSNFKKGSVEMIILVILNSESMYGYQISQSIFERSGGFINVPEGSLYPTLYKLLDNGYVVDEKRLAGKRRTRIYYSITDSGRKHLKELYIDYIAVKDGIQGIIEASSFDGGKDDE